MIYNICGQPHSGKTTLANYLKKVLEVNNPKKKVFIVDGDVLRKILNNKDYSEKGRRDNIHQAYSIAKYLNETDNFDVILALVSPFKAQRDLFRFATDCIEIFVHTTNIRGKENFHVENYEKPNFDYIDIDTTDVDELTSVNELMEKITQHIEQK